MSIHFLANFIYLIDLLVLLNVIYFFLLCKKFVSCLKISYIVSITVILPKILKPHKLLLSELNFCHLQVKVSKYNIIFTFDLYIYSYNFCGDARNDFKKRIEKIINRLSSFS